MGYHDILDVLAGDGCAICTLVKRDVDRYFDALLYEYVTEFDVQDQFRAARGLCNPHAWQITQYSGNALGITILCDVALDEVLSIVEKTPTRSSPMQRLFKNSPAQALSENLAPTAPCSACRALDESEARHLQILQQHLGDAKLIEKFAESDGLCLPHFRNLLSLTQQEEQSTRLIELQKSIWKRLKTELETFIHKYNFEYAGETMGKEGGSRFRAIRSLSGEKEFYGRR